MVAELRAMKLKEAAKKVEDGIEETLTYCDFPSEHWTRIRTNNVIERLNREIRRRTRVVGTFSDGSRWGQRLGQKKRHPKIATYEKQKPSKSYDFEGFWHAVRDSNPRPSGP